MSILDGLQNHPCYAAAEAALAELVQQAHGHPIRARASDDGSISLELRGEDWRVLLCLEADPADSGWSWVHINPSGIAIGGLGDMADLGPLVRLSLVGSL